jgi:hypothetical protein
MVERTIQRGGCGMTIEEAIKHCEEVAYQNEILMKRYDDASGYNRSHNENIRTDGAKGCEQLISLYRQLAEWLKELKAYEEAREEIGCLPIVWEEGAGIRKCIDILDKHLKEVNADDE